MDTAAETSRQEKTKCKLAASVKGYMRTQPTDRITMKNIVEGHGVARQTFYRSFLNEYDLINWYSDGLVLQFFKQIGMGHTVGESLTHKFGFVLDGRVFFTETFHSDNENSLKGHNLGLILKFYTDLPARKDGEALNQELRSPSEMHCQGPVYMIIKWVLGGVKDSSRDMPGKLTEAVPPKLAEILKHLKLLQVIVDNENS